MSKAIIIVLLLFFSIIPTKAQWTNNWQDHFSYRQPNLIAESESYIIAANSTGLTIYDYSTGQSRKKSIVTGLSDVDISAISSIGNDRFIIGYENGNIDILSNSGVINIPDLKNKQLQGSKTINHFSINGDIVYCSTNFGILVFNSIKLEISDTYYLGLESSNLVIHQCTTLNNKIYAATERGLLMADLDDPLLAYYKSWSEIGNTNEDYFGVSPFQNKLITVSRSGSNPYQILIGNKNEWDRIKNTSSYRNIGVSNDSFIITEANYITRYNSNLEVIEAITHYSNTEIEDPTIRANQCIFSSSKQAYFIADNSKGLGIIEGENEDFILPDGPYSNDAAELLFSPHGLYTVAGGLTADYNNSSRRAEFSLYQNNHWTSYRNTIRDDNYLWRDLIRVCDTPTDDDIVYMSSWGGGIFVVKQGQVINHYNHLDSNCTLENIFPDGNQNFVRVGGIASDSDGNIWMSNAYASNGISIREGSDTSKWQAFNYEILNNINCTDKFMIAQNNYVWIIIPRLEKKGLVVINPNNTPLDQSDDQYRGPISNSEETDPRNVGLLRIWDESLDVITDKVYCITEDKNGYVWLGTDKGVVVYYRPWTIFSETYPIASRIKIPRNDGSNQADYLLEKENITSIVIDGANRKWIGTQASGLFLVSDDGITTYESFNTDNSPLPSNTINSIAINPNSGDVFIATPKGIVSYKGKATEGSESLNTIYAYPNPVREDYSGDITITGLVKDSYVKITTISGKLVYETRSLGGKAYWNGRNLKGQKVKSGVYIAYISSEDGSDVETTKIMIVR
nr:two-component regulator propeller domain-containing protein [uncultured Carboxylicivirga sp.]